MRITDSIVKSNQNVINYWTAKSSYEDLEAFIVRTANKVEVINESTIFIEDDSNIFNRDFATEDECLKNYCVRAKVVKMATETCELFCKAILIDNGKRWDEMQSIGHNLLSCYQALSEKDKNLIESVPLDMVMHNKQFFAQILTLPVGVEEKYKDEYPEEYPIPLSDFLNSFATGRILPNIKARYPGQTLVDYNESFIIGFTKLLYSFVITKEKAQS